MDISLQLEQQLLELQVAKAKEELAAAESQTAYNRLALLPHRTYVPRLSHDGICWVAVAEFSDGSKLVGRGDCPNKALMDYSNQWLGVKGE